MPDHKVDSPLVSEIVQDHRNLHGWTHSNQTNQLPIYMVFNDGNKLSIAVNSVLFVFGSIANVTVLLLLIKRRKKSPSRINSMLIHLAIADLLVTFLMMPLEIAWNATVQWTAGDAMCRILMFFRIFGLYLSSNVLICISIDRYYAVLKPMHLADLDRREKWMLIFAWIGAFVSSLPQMIIFHVETHPDYPWFRQCVTYNFFPTDTIELIYNLSGGILMYTLPLGVIIYTYTAILIEIFRRTRNPHLADSITRSSLAFLGKAKVRTLKMTLIIVLVFIFCWTPYHVMCVWYWFDSDSANEIDPKIQKGLFLFACANSCMNPIVYGVFNVRARRRGVQRRDRLQSNPLPYLNGVKEPSMKGSATNGTRLKRAVPPPLTAETRLSPLELSLKSLE